MVVAVLCLFFVMILGSQSNQLSVLSLFIDQEFMPVNKAHFPVDTYLAIFLMVIPFFIGIIVLFTHDYVQIDLNQNKVRACYSFLGIRMGDWKKLDHYPYLFILTENTSFFNWDRIKALFRPADTLVYDLYLGSADHLRKIRIFSTKDQQELQAHIKKLEKVLEKSYVKYNPGRRDHLEIIH